MPRKREGRLYKKRRRWYADFRDFKDVGGRQEALIRKSERYGTTSRKVATRLAKARLAELRRLRKAGHGGRDEDLRMLGPFVDYHLEREARRKGADAAHLAQVAQRLEVAVEYFGEGTLMRSIGTLELQRYVEYLATRVRWEGRDNPGAEPITATTQRKYLSALAKVFRRARAVHVTARSHRPFADLMDWPEPDEDQEAVWLDGPTAVLFLEAARLYEPKRADRAVPCAYTIVATVILTGMRPSEALGLRIEDIDFERGLIRVRRNRGRRLKNRGSKRFVPLWPQLEGILRAYLEERGRPTEGFLFPSPTREGKPVRSIKRLIAELGHRVGLDVNLTPKVLRHTYCAARLQTTDAEKPVAVLAVARELGHRDTAMVERIYGHADTKETSFIRRPFVAFESTDYEGPEFAQRMAEMEESSRERNCPAPVLLRRVAPETELAILRNAAAAPQLGPRKAAEALRQDGHEISASGVRWILLRYDLHREDLRREALKSGRFQDEMRKVQELRSG